MEDNQSRAEAREALLDQGYNVLLTGTWEQAEQIFDGLLQEDPHCGLSCLGKAMAVHQIHSREELKTQWAGLCRDPEFQALLNPAEPDFLRWLQQEMEGSPKRPRLRRPAVDFSDLALYLPDFSSVGTGRLLLLIFSGVQVLLLLLTAFAFWKTTETTERLFLNLFLNLVLTAVVTGLPVILGPIYGNSIVEVGRFCTLWKILNNIVCVLGILLYGMLAAAGFLSIRESAVPAQDDICYVTAFALAFLIHLLSLIMPIILDKVEYG